MMIEEIVHYFSSAFAFFGLITVIVVAWIGLFDEVLGRWALNRRITGSLVASLKVKNLLDDFFQTGKLYQTTRRQLWKKAVPDLSKGQTLWGPNNEKYIDAKGTVLLLKKDIEIIYAGRNEPQGIQITLEGLIGQAPFVHTSTYRDFSKLENELTNPDPIFNYDIDIILWPVDRPGTILRRPNRKKNTKRPAARSTASNVANKKSTLPLK